MPGVPAFQAGGSVTQQQSQLDRPLGIVKAQGQAGRRFRGMRSGGIRQTG